MSNPQLDFKVVVLTFFLHTQLEAFRRYEATEPGRWQIDQVKSDTDYANTGSPFSIGRGALLELSRAVPIPSGETPLEEVLNFRSKRIDEIRELMTELHRAYERIISSIDRELSLVSEIEQIERKCAAVLRVAQESKISFKVGDLGVGFSVNVGAVLQSPAFAAAGELLGEGYGMHTIGALLGGALPFLSLKGGLGVKGKQNSDSPFRVIVKIHSELISL